MPTDKASVVVVEDDPFLRMVGLVLDPTTRAERQAAFADFFAHEEPDFEGYCARVRERAGKLYPAEVRLVETESELRANLADCSAIVVEAFAVGPAELAAAPKLRAVQQFGLSLRNIDMGACAARGVRVLTLRRRANIACAEHAIGLMLMLAREMRLAGKITAQALAAEGFPYRPFDRRHTANSNWGRIPGVRILHEATIGILGLGEIGREIARRASAFGMHVRYHQRQQLGADEERALGVAYVPLDRLLAESDWLIPQLPSGDATRHFLDRTRLAAMKPGAFIVNVSRPDVVDRSALIAALKSGHLGGFALDPQYESPGRDDDELLQFDNVILTPHLAAQPRFNALNDIEELITGLARELA